MKNLPMDITFVEGDGGFEVGYCLTRNQICGAPIKYIRDHINNRADALIINNKISNVAARSGDENCAKVVDKVKATFNVKNVIPASTGVIGWDLPVDEMVSAIDTLPEAESCTPLEFASAIMTTDRWPKLESAKLGKSSLMVGAAKGAGMIEPNMGTMLCYVLADCKPPTSKLQSIVERVADKTFNCISVDGDESTSDMFVVLCKEDGEEVKEKDFEDALEGVCEKLASGIVRNGEGTGHVIKVEVMNYPGPDSEAREMGKSVINSPLVKTAIAGNDPNVGRIAGAFGSWVGKREGGGTKIDWSKCNMSMGGENERGVACLTLPFPSPPFSLAASKKNTLTPLSPLLLSSTVAAQMKVFSKKENSI